MPRAIWSGAISLGLVNVPVRMVSAIAERDVHFHLLHTKDDSRIGYEKVCKQEGKAVPDDEIAKAYEVAEGEYVYLTDEDFAAAEGESHRRIDLGDFVPYDEIDPIYFERTYYLLPADGAEKPYGLLAEAMEGSGLAGIATFVMRDRQQLACLRVREGVITLERMYFADEVREPGEVERVRVGKQELKMAEQLIGSLAGSFDIDKYRDEYRESLLRVIRAKAKGKTVEPPPVEEPEVPDLLEALKASLRGRKGANGNGDLSKLTRDELAKQAKRMGVRGYSKMTKRELVQALGRRAVDSGRA